VEYQDRTAKDTFMKSIINREAIERKIYLIRGQRVMLDSDLAELYGVEVKQLKRQVRRNIDRFPADFMFQLSKEEDDSLRCHFGTLKRGEHSKYLPYGFTEQGIAMLSSVLNSKRAVQVNIAIMRAFVKLREMIASHKDLARKLDELEKKYDSQFQIVFEAIRQLMAIDEMPKRKIGFEVREARARYKTFVRDEGNQSSENGNDQIRPL
jgi:phage regulator Rha-like protein